MFPLKALLSFILVSLSVGAIPLTHTTGKSSLSFATKINTDSLLNVAKRDRARAQTLKSNVRHMGKRSKNVSIMNALVVYTAQVGVGSPPTNYTLLIDNGSSSTWVGANPSNPYVQTITSQDTGNTVSVSYGSASFSGKEYTDTVTLSPGLVITQQSVGVANSAIEILPNCDGILGIGPVYLTKDTVSNTNTVPTVVNNLFSDGAISKEVLGIYFVPASESNSGGTLTFGGVDDSVTTSSVKYVSLTTTSPSSEFWGINQSIAYGGTTILSETAGIIDTGSTFVEIATKAYSQYQSLTGGTLDSSVGLLAITSLQYSNLQTLSFNIGGTSYDLSPNAQIWPRSLNTALGGSPGSIYLIVIDIGSNGEPGLDFIIGYTFLERYYSVFDTTNSRVGFASTAYTDATTN